MTQPFPPAPLRTAAAPTAVSSPPRLPVRAVQKLDGSGPQGEPSQGPHRRMWCPFVLCLCAQARRPPLWVSLSCLGWTLATAAALQVAGRNGGAHSAWSGARCVVGTSGSVRPCCRGCARHRARAHLGRCRLLWGAVPASTPCPVGAARRLRWDVPRWVSHPDAETWNEKVGAFPRARFVPSAAFPRRFPKPLRSWVNEASPARCLLRGLFPAQVRLGEQGAACDSHGAASCLGISTSWDLGKGRSRLRASRLGLRHAFQLLSR